MRRFCTGGLETQGERISSGGLREQVRQPISVLEAAGWPLLPGECCPPSHVSNGTRTSECTCKQPTTLVSEHCMAGTHAHA